jgi:hypothetical protein
MMRGTYANRSGCIRSSAKGTELRDVRGVGPMLSGYPYAPAVQWPRPGLTHGPVGVSFLEGSRNKGSRGTIASVCVPLS